MIKLIINSFGYYLHFQHFYFSKWTVFINFTKHIKEFIQFCRHHEQIDIPHPHSLKYIKKRIIAFIQCMSIYYLFKYGREF